MSLNPYFIAAAFFVFVAVFMLVTGRYVWSLPFAGGALALYFMGMSNESEGGDR